MPHALLYRSWLAAWLFVPLLAGNALAQLQPPQQQQQQPLTLASDPALLAKAALGTERGTMVVGTLRNGQAAYGAAYNPEPPSQPRRSFQPIRR